MLSYEKRKRDADRMVRVRLVELAAHGIMALVVALFIALILINWVTGCGEVFHGVDGSVIYGECVSPLDLFQ